MVTFIVLAAVLALVGVALVAVPLVRRDPKQLAPAPWAALGAAALLVVGSAILYASFSKWSWHAEPAADSPQTMVARLARKLERDPNDVNGWLLLGRSYIVLEQYPLALRSYQRADRLAGGKNAEALVGEAESLTMSDESALDGRAGRIIEQALVLDPNSGKGLFFGAAAAARRGELPLARERFTKLLAMDPPQAVRPILEQQIAAIDQKLAHKVSYPFVCGAVFLTLIWPAVSYFIRALAYLFGNMAMALGDSEPLYNWDYASMYAIKSNFASPVYKLYPSPNISGNCDSQKAWMPFCPVSWPLWFSAVCKGICASPI